MIELTATILDRRWNRAAHSLVDGIVATAPAVLAKYEINTPLRLAHFMAQCSEESSGGSAVEENLHYSASRLHAVWPSRFPSVASAMPYARNPRLLADKVYNGRMGNRSGTDDGWNYRGRGLIQITGEAEYAKIAAISGVDIKTNPNLATDPMHALEVAAAFWKSVDANAYADRDDILHETKVVNGGLTGLALRKSWLATWKRELHV